MTTRDPLVEVSGLTVDFGPVRAVDGLSFTLEAGGALGVVGESGSGKSASAYALLGLHRGTGARVGGSVRVAGTDVNTADDRELRALRGAGAAMVFQDPLSSLDPYYPVGDQIAEVYRVHRPVSRRAARARAVEVLDRVGIPDAARRSRLRPHEFSGGMRQRALIAMALACEPGLLIADEPTTALDVTVQAQILDLLHDLRHETGMGLLLVTHDVGVAAESVDEVLVMRHGKEVERGPVARVLGAPREPYTKELLAAVPRVETRRVVPVPPPRVAEDAAPLLEAVGLRREFGRGSGRVAAVDGVSLTVHAGRTLGIVGESGSGKTTLGRMLVRLLDPTAGRLRYGGREIGSLPEKELRSFRRDLQMVFQDPVASLNPRRSVGESVADPLRAAGESDEGRIRDRVGTLLERVGLDPAHFERYPHEFSGGQRQRVGIARALAAEPKLIVCDEPVSALDVTTQAQVVQLLSELQRELGIGLVFIAHDLAVVRQVSDEVAVMRRGVIVEQGSADAVYADPRDPYTRQLLAAVPALDPGLAAARRTAREELARA
ncbi:ABC transporter ATP-binding protein [Streptomyces anulatus]|uniref:dipeptide ABC transporter ATP-binding protein n=1 Tax=Streptomyces anulatus TaxID=1892 RepID=UPI00225A8847|nr:ABC transporter ATP-binding protein [Streptomyces anulatus]MCX4503265.1 ABC transporter ATP-binding protein [Streptomyces anulatus]WTD12554.1 ABC transporter ATP-binding protein [Streptomyces anulatus]WTE05865.1 ABC transporter ATP-binding protein [Streptomyces anulatus]